MDCKVAIRKGRRKRQRIDVSRRRQRRTQAYPCLVAVLLLTCSTCLVPPVSSLTGNLQVQGKGKLFPNTRQSTTRRMVLTTPESIIEQASTQNLLDDLIDESVRTSARGPIMMQFNPSSGWIWKRWRGTIFSETWESCLKSMIYAVAVLLFFKRFPNLKVQLAGFNILWGQLLSVTTFTLTFFVNQSYALWRKCYELSRRLQGRLHDVGMTLAIHAARKTPANPNEPSTYTASSRQLLELVGRYVRLFNVLTYASFTRSHRPILTPRGMRRLVERGLMTAQERECLVEAEVPATQRHNAVLLWITRLFVEGWQAGHFIGATGFENQILEKIHVCRAQYGAIGDELAGRMPLAYAHIVQILVDAVLWFYPFMAIASQMSDGLVVLGTGLLTICYQGLFDLAKQFLDPYDNESYGKGEDPLVVDTLISETNAGSVRWMNSLSEFPVSPQRIQEGDLTEYILPTRGYSVEELTEMEEEKTRRERELQELRDREEEERRIVKKKATLLRQAAEAMISAKLDKQKHPVASDSSTISVGTTSTDLVSDISCTDDTFSLSSTAAVSQVVSNMNAMIGGIPSSLLPVGTAASLEDDTLVIQKRKRIMSIVEPESSDPTDDGENSMPDGRGYEGYPKRMEEFGDASGSSNFVETEDILSAVSSTEDDTETSKDRAKERINDRTKVAGLSKLLGNPTGQASQLPVYSEPQNTGDNESRSIAQLFGEAEFALPKFMAEDNLLYSEELPSFGPIDPLWDGVDEDINGDDGFEGTAPETSKAYADIQNQGDGPGLPVAKLLVTDGSELRLSQILADEVWKEEEVRDEVVIEQYVSMDEYAQQIADILEAEKEEQLETEAIMNAPSFAEYVGTSGDDRESSTGRAANSTRTDELSVFEMDVVQENEEPSSQETLNEWSADSDSQDRTKEDSLASELIMSGSSGAPEEESESSDNNSSPNGSSKDDAAGLKK